MFDRSTENGNDMVQKVDKAIHWIILYPTDSTIIIAFPNTNPVDSDLSGE